MNQMLFVLYGGIIQFLEERDLKLTRLSAFISPYSAKFKKRNNSPYSAKFKKRNNLTTAFSLEILISFSPNRGHLCDFFSK